MPGASLGQLDWPTIAGFIGVGIGTATAVVLGYKRAFKEPTPVTSSHDIVLPTATIASMKPVEEVAHKLGEIAACLGGIHKSLLLWREEDEERREKERIEEEAFRRGRDYAERSKETPSRPPGRRRPDIS